MTATAASPTRAVQITGQGSCTRRLALPVLALRAALKRDRAAEHVAVVEADGGAGVCEDVPAAEDE